MQGVDSVGRPLLVDGIAGPVTLAAIATRLAGGGPSLPPVAFLFGPGGSATARGALGVAVAEYAGGHGEQGGNNMGPDVKRYLNGVNPPAYWCAAFVSYCFKNSGQPMPFIYDLGARSILAQLRAKGWGVKPTDAAPPLPGDLLVFWRNSPSSWEGHIGIVFGYADGIVQTIEGNKTPKVGKFSYTLGAIDKLLGFARVP